MDGSNSTMMDGISLYTEDGHRYGGTIRNHRQPRQEQLPLDQLTYMRHPSTSSSRQTAPAAYNSSRHRLDDATAGSLRSKLPNADAAASRDQLSIKGSRSGQQRLRKLSSAKGAADGSASGRDVLWTSADSADHGLDKSVRSGYKAENEFISCLEVKYERGSKP